MSTDPIDAYVRNLFLLQRLGNGLDRTSRDVLERLFREAAAELIRLDPLGVSARYRAARLRRLIEELRPIVQRNIADWQRVVRQELADIGAQQARAVRGTIIDAMGGGPRMGGLRISMDDGGVLPGVNFFKAILDDEPFRGLILREHAERLGARTTAALTAEVRMGMLAQETIPQVTRRMRRVVAGSSAREAEAIARTAVNHVATTARLETFRRNPGIVAGWQFVAVLDDRTTPICISLDGREFAVGDETAPRPPLHYNCRSTAVPVVDFAALGLPEPPPGFRAAQGGTRVGRDVTYEQWLRMQSVERQNDVLGVARGRAFRAGASLKSLIREDGTWVRASELTGAAA